MNNNGIRDLASIIAPCWNQPVSEIVPDGAKEKQLMQGLSNHCEKVEDSDRAPILSRLWPE